MKPERFLSGFRALVACLVLGAIGQAAAQALCITPIARAGQVVVSFALTDGLTPEVLDAIQSGLATSFSYEVELRRSAALVDRTIASVSIRATVRFDNLTRRYQMSRSVDGRVED